MYKQKQVPCCCIRKRNRCSRHFRSTKKNKQILETYVVNPQRIRLNSMYQVIQKEKLQALKKKQSDQYLIINPNLKYLKSYKTENSELQDEYLEQLKTIKSQIKNLQKDMQDKKIPQYSPPPIEIHPTISLNPQLLDRLDHRKYMSPKQFRSREIKMGYQQKKRSHSVINTYDEDLSELREQVQQLRRQITLDKKFKQSYKLPLINKYEPYNQYVANSRNIFSRNSSTSKKLDSIFVVNPKQKSQFQTINTWRQKAKDEVRRKIRKVVNAIFFTVYLRKFSQKIRMKRENFFRQSYQQNIYYQISILKSSFIKSTQQLISTLPINQTKSLIITSNDNQKQRQLKIHLTRKYLNSFFDIIGESEFLPNMANTLMETCYFVCRHGSAGVNSNYFTAEELDIMCISKYTLKISSQKHLEKSQIINFIWVKLIIFNILLRTDNIQELKLHGNIIWNSNFYLLGSLVYQIARNLQSQLIQRAPMNYVIGNWKHINFLNSKNSHNKKAINPCKSMIMTEKPFNKTLRTEDSPNQLIQGTLSKSYLSQAYQFQKWETQERKISNFINFIHKKMCKYHAKMKQELV